jgi:hypothetical protein
MIPRQTVALVLDPRFAGGTSSAVAREILALAPVTDLRVVFVETAMFRGGKTVNARIASALDDSGITPTWNPPVISASTVVIHNPSCLKFDTSFAPRLNCGQVIAVAHENFLRPDGSLAFDVGKTLKLISDRAPASRKVVAPVSPQNRATIVDWLADTALPDWSVAPVDWFNICDFDLVAPNPAPRDRRGRVSRPGFEKFPDLATMRAHFPPHAERCAILGADSFLLPGSEPPPHWLLLPFGGADVADFLQSIDFFVYFTHPNLRESFGRVLAEAIAAGKVVITDPGTAQNFGDAVVSSDGSDVDATVASFVADPDRYVRFVTAAQRRLAAFSAETFRNRICTYLRDQTSLGEAA